MMIMITCVWGGGWGQKKDEDQFVIGFSFVLFFPPRGGGAGVRVIGEWTVSVHGLCASNPLKKTRTLSCARGELLSVVAEHLHDGDGDARVAGARHRAQLCAKHNYGRNTMHFFSARTFFVNGEEEQKGTHTRRSK